MSPRLFILGHTTPSKLSYNLYILYCRCSGNHIAGNVKAINLMLTFFIYFRWLYELPFMRFAMLRSQSITFFPISFFGRLMSKTTWNPLPVQFMTRSNEMLILMINMGFDWTTITHCENVKCVLNVKEMILRKSNNWSGLARRYVENAISWPYQYYHIPY